MKDIVGLLGVAGLFWAIGNCREGTRRGGSAIAKGLAPALWSEGGDNNWEGATIDCSTPRFSDTFYRMAEASPS